MLRARERVVHVVDGDLRVALLEGSSSSSGGFWAGGEPRRVLAAVVLSRNLSNAAPLEPSSSSNTGGGDSQGRVNGRWASWTTARMRQLKRRFVAQANMSTLRWTVLSVPPLR
jgi:hypothetical protein